MRNREPLIKFHIAATSISKITAGQNRLSIYLNSALNVLISRLIYLIIFVAMLE
jgi:hypothetical protein